MKKSIFIMIFSLACFAGVAYWLISGKDERPPVIASSNVISQNVNQTENYDYSLDQIPSDAVVFIRIKPSGFHAAGLAIEGFGDKISQTKLGRKLALANIV